MKEKFKIVLTGGGTGGHIYPNLALIPTLKKNNFDIVYIGGNGDTMEKRLATNHKLEYYGVDTIKLVRSISPKALKNNIKIPTTLKKSINETIALLSKIKPDIIFSKGGFVSLPVILAGKKLGIPLFCHESDLTLGLANKIAQKKGATCLKGNPNSKFDGIFTGIPIREELFCTNKSKARQKLGFNEKDKIILIVGGSSGAKAINTAVFNNLDNLTKANILIHITGKNKNTLKGNSEYDNQSTINDIKEKKAFSNYIQLEYADNIGDYLHASDLVVSRAGATAVFEISALKKKALFIPLPKGISRGDQIYNAELAKEYGANILIQDKDFENIFENAVLKSLTISPMKSIENDANGKIVGILCDSIRRGELCRNKKPSQNG